MKNLLKSLVFLIFLLIVWGAVVRGTGSGLGCPDWPLCHGQLIPPFEKAVLIEYFHRLLASAVGILTLVICIKIWRDQNLRTQFGKKCGVILGLLVLQIILGGVTVKTELHAHIVTTHLGIGLIFLSLIFTLFLQVHRPLSIVHSPSLISYWRPAILFLQILLGGLVAASNAGLACPDFPTCQGVWFPPMDGLVAIHFLHRIGAIIILLMALSLAVTQWRSRIVKIIFSLVLLQILLGVGAVQMGLPFAMRIAHNAVAVLLFLALLFKIYESRRIR